MLGGLICDFRIVLTVAISNFSPFRCGNNCVSKGHFSVRVYIVCFDSIFRRLRCYLKPHGGLFLRPDCVETALIDVPIVGKH